MDVTGRTPNTTSYRDFMDRRVSPVLARWLGPALPRLLPDRLLQRLGDHVVVCSAPQAADAVLVLGGGSRRRLEWAVELHRRQLAPRVLATSSVHSARLARSGARNSFEALKQLGVASEALTWLPWPRNTFEEAGAVAELMEQQPLSRLLVVTEPFHSRRAWRTLRHVLGTAGPEILLTCPPETSARAIRWWERRRDLEGVLGELISLVYYRLRYGV